jgi:protein gp37
MSDLFLEDIPEDFMGKMIRTMKNAHWHCFQVLTKRPKRMVEWVDSWVEKNGKWPKNVWLGVSVESHDYMWRIGLLKRTPAVVKFISFEPLLEKIKVQSESLKGIQWVIVGGESGHKARPMKREWVEEIFLQTREKGIPFFFKQWGTYNSQGIMVGKKTAGRIFKGHIWNESPRFDYD